MGASARPGPGRGRGGGARLAGRGEAGSGLAERDGGARASTACAVPVRRNMTDNLPPGDNGTGEAQEGAAQPQPWFPPAGEPGGFGQPPPFDPGQAPPGAGQPGGYGQQGYGEP